MSDEDLKAELERLRSENAALKKGASTSIRMKVSEKGARLDLRHGALSRDLIQRTVAEAAGHVRRHSRVHCCERGAIEEKGLSGRSNSAGGGTHPVVRRDPLPCVIKSGAKRGVLRNEEIVRNDGRADGCNQVAAACTNRGVVLTSNGPACRWRGSRRRTYALSRWLRSPYSPVTFSATYSSTLRRTLAGSRGADRILLTVDAESPEFLWIPLSKVQVVLRHNPRACA